MFTYIHNLNCKLFLLVYVAFNSHAHACTHVHACTSTNTQAHTFSLSFCPSLSLSRLLARSLSLFLYMYARKHVHVFNLSQTHNPFSTHAPNLRTFPQTRSPATTHQSAEWREFRAALQAPCTCMHYV